MRFPHVVVFTFVKVIQIRNCIEFLGKPAYYWKEKHFSHILKNQYNDEKEDDPIM